MYEDNLSSRLSAFLFVACSVSIHLFLNVSRIKHGVPIIQKMFPFLLWFFVVLICVARFISLDYNFLGYGFNAYIGSGLAGLIFTLSYFYLRLICTDIDRLLVNLFFCITAVLVANFVGLQKDVYAIMLAVCLSVVWFKVKGWFACHKLREKERVSEYWKIYFWKCFEV